MHGFKIFNTGLLLTLATFSLVGLAQVPSMESNNNIILGEWHGDLVPSPGLSVTFGIEFTSDSENQIIGEMENKQIQTAKQTIVAVRFEGNELTFSIPATNSTYKGTFDGESIVGDLYQSGRSMQFNLEMGAYVALEPKLQLDEADYMALGGLWSGNLTFRGRTQEFNLRVQRNVEGAIMAFVDSVDENATFMITTASLEDQELSFEIALPPVRFVGSVSDEKILGKWIQNGNEIDLEFLRLATAP